MEIGDQDGSGVPRWRWGSWIEAGGLDERGSYKEVGLPDGGEGPGRRWGSWAEAGDPSVTHLAVSTQGLAAVAPPYPSQHGSAAGRIWPSLPGMPGPGTAPPAQLLRDGPELKNNPGPAPQTPDIGTVGCLERAGGCFTAISRPPTCSNPWMSQALCAWPGSAPLSLNPKPPRRAGITGCFPKRWDRLEPRTPLLRGHHFEGGFGPRNGDRSGASPTCPHWQLPRTSSYQTGSSEGHARRFTHSLEQVSASATPLLHFDPAKPVAPVAGAGAGLDLVSPTHRWSMEEAFPSLEFGRGGSCWVCTVSGLGTLWWHQARGVVAFPTVASMDGERDES